MKATVAFNSINTFFLNDQAIMVSCSEYVVPATACIALGNVTV